MSVGSLACVTPAPVSSLKRSTFLRLGASACPSAGSFVAARCPVAARSVLWLARVSSQACASGGALAGRSFIPLRHCAVPRAKEAVLASPHCSSIQIATAHARQPAREPQTREKEEGTREGVRQRGTQAATGRAAPCIAARSSNRPGPAEPPAGALRATRRGALRGNTTQDAASRRIQYRQRDRLVGAEPAPASCGGGGPGAARLGGGPAARRRGRPREAPCERGAGRRPLGAGRWHRAGRTPQAAAAPARPARKGCAHQGRRCWQVPAEPSASPGVGGSACSPRRRPVEKVPRPRSAPRAAPLLACRLAALRPPDRPQWPCYPKGVCGRQPCG